MSELPRIKIGFLLYEGVEEMDVVGPWEVFGTLTELRPGAAELHAIARSMDPLRGNHGLRLRADVPLGDAPDLDLLVIPGGKGRREAMNDPLTIRFLRERRPITERFASVCTGAFLLAEAGLLAGRDATTHPRLLDALRAWPGVRVREERVVDGGDLLTSGGVACGIDLALHLVGTLCGEDAREAVAREMCYVPPAR